MSLRRTTATSTRCNDVAMRRALGVSAAEAPQWSSTQAVTLPPKNRLDHALLVGLQMRMSNASLSSNVSALYEKVIIDSSEKELKRVQKKFNTLSGDGWRNGERQKKLMTNWLRQKTEDVDAIRYWTAQDFTMVRVPTLQELFDPKVYYYVGSATAKVSYPYFREAYDAFDKDENYETQSELLDTTYEQYVATHTNSEIVKMWTMEADETSNAPPHQVMEDKLLRDAKLFRPEDFNMDIDSFDPFYENKNKFISELYALVTEAPRCPAIMSFVRTIQSKTRLPSTWFKRIHKREMELGESVKLPVFMSTSNLNLGSSWLAYGYASEGENCCIMQIIVPKGIPMLPLYGFESNEHQHENEILLPPGIELVYTDYDDYTLGDNDDYVINTFTFVARIPEDPKKE